MILTAQLNLCDPDFALRLEYFSLFLMPPKSYQLYVRAISEKLLKSLEQSCIRLAGGVNLNNHSCPTEATF